jgi:hypothetical protein
MKLPETQLVDDKDGKPAGIHQFIGRVHQTDADRELAYDRRSIGRLDKALDEAQTRAGWSST